MDGTYVKEKLASMDPLPPTTWALAVNVSPPVPVPEEAEEEGADELWAEAREREARRIKILGLL